MRDSELELLEPAQGGDGRAEAVGGEPPAPDVEAERGEVRASGEDGENSVRDGGVGRSVAQCTGFGEGMPVDDGRERRGGDGELVDERGARVPWVTRVRVEEGKERGYDAV